MSVRYNNTIISRIRKTLVETLKNEKASEVCFIRLVAILCFKSIEYNKFKGFNFDYSSFKELNLLLDEKISGIFSQFFYELNEECFLIIKEELTELFIGIKESSDLTFIGNLLQSYRDAQRDASFTSTNRNLDKEIDASSLPIATQIFTPIEVVKYMVDKTISTNINQKVLDPCVGTGNILLYAVDRYIELNYKNKIDLNISEVYDHFYGLDIDPIAISVSKFLFVLKALKYDQSFLEKDYRLPHLILIDDFECDFEDFKKASLFGSLIRPIESSVSKFDSIYEINNILKSKFDVIITNPPYMGRKVMPKELLLYLQENYRFGKSELYVAFMERLLEMLKPNGYLSMITLHTWMFIKSYSGIRKEILNNYQIESLLHLGPNTFENLNAYNALACCFVIKNIVSNEKSKFYKLTDYQTIDLKMKAINDDNLYLVNQRDFLQINDAPIIYWIDKKAYDVLINNKSLCSYFEIKQGLATGNNKEFIKYWYEVDRNLIGFNQENIEEFLKNSFIYAPYNKGGKSTKWYMCSKTVIKFDKEAVSKLEKQGNRLPSKRFYFKEGITWSLFGFNSFNVRFKEKGYVFDVSGSSLFCDYSWRYCLAFLSSDVAFYYLSVLAPTVNFQVGNISSLPFIHKKEYELEINELVDSLISDAFYLDSLDESSWNFKENPLIINSSLEESMNIYLDKILLINKRMFENEERINELFNDIYGFKPKKTKRSNYYTNELIEVKKLISYLVGIHFNRYEKLKNKETINISLLSEVTLSVKNLLNEYFIDGVSYVENILKQRVDSYLKKNFISDHEKQFVGFSLYSLIKKEDYYLKYNCCFN